MKKASGRDLARIIQTAVSASWLQIATEEGERIADEYKALLRENLENQTLKLTPLSDAYAKRKASAGLDPRTLLASKAYIDSFETKQVSEKEWRVQCKDEEHPTAGMTFDQLGMTHEYGSRTARIPPRPHWGPTTNEFWSRKPTLEKELLEKLVTKARDLVLVEIEGGSKVK